MEYYPTKSIESFYCPIISSNKIICSDVTCLQDNVVVPIRNPSQSHARSEMINMHIIQNRRESEDSSGSELSVDYKSSFDEIPSNEKNVSFGLDNSNGNEEISEMGDTKSLQEQIVEQVELYLSDDSIMKNKFLRKHLKSNKNGFISLKLISSLKNVKHLTKDWRVVGMAIDRKSKCLQLNDTKTKVCRLNPLPENDGITVDPNRTVVAFDFPNERPTIEAVRRIFSVFGNVTFIRILRPGNPIPIDIKQFIHKHCNLKTKVCALIEYEKSKYALRTVLQLKKMEQDLQTTKTCEMQTTLKVIHLTTPEPPSIILKAKDLYESKFSKISHENNCQYFNKTI